MLLTIKQSRVWSDLADYYLALQYDWNLVNNGKGWGFNQRIGTEMMNAFLTVHNPYVAQYVRCLNAPLLGSSSQSVDDK